MAMAWAPACEASNSRLSRRVLAGAISFCICAQLAAALAADAAPTHRAVAPGTLPRLGGCWLLLSTSRVL
jgi:hypothetical protein